jgi:hypothetical protein
MVALGLLAAVLISVAGLLVLGNRLVKGGRSSSTALAVARDILEELHGWSYHQTYEIFGCDGGQPTCTVDSSHPEMQRWKQVLDENLAEARAEILFESMEAAAPPLSETRALRMTVSVFWKDAQRARSTRLSTVRM